MNETHSFGYWVRRRRKALDLTQAELAAQVGCAEVTIRYRRTLDTARAVFGPVAFAAVWAAGQTMTLEQVITYALGEAE